MENERQYEQYNAVVTAVCASSFGTMWMAMCLETSLLLYMNHVHFTTDTDTSFFIRTVAFGLLVPILASVPLGYTSDKYGPRHTLSVAYLLVALGFVVVYLSRTSRALFLFGYTLFKISDAFRIVRFNILGQIVSPARRTFIMSIHQLMLLLGFFVSPITWLIIQQWAGEVVLVPDVLVIDRFSILITVCTTAALSLAVISYTMLILPTRSISKPETRHAIHSAHSHSLASPSETSVKINGSTTCHPSAHHEHKETIRQYRNTRFAFFTIIILMMRFTFAILRCIFQPILIGHFHSTDSQMGHIYLLISFFAIFPPFIVALLSRLIDDRKILLLGLCIKLVGGSLFLPLTGPNISKWQPIVGYLLVITSTAFCTAASMSLFTKLLGRLCSATTIAYMLGVAESLPAFVQIAFGKGIALRFTSWSFGVFVAPIAVAMLLVVSPAGWAVLDTKSEWTTSVLKMIGE